jgi:hypothetical protein
MAVRKPDTNKTILHCDDDVLREATAVASAYREENEGRRVIMHCGIDFEVYQTPDTGTVVVRQLTDEQEHDTDQ